MYAVTVTFRVAADHLEAFLPLMVENAQTSLQQEPGCHQFDICRGENPNQVFLYEIYDDRAAFDAHLASAHFKSFDSKVADMIEEKTVALFDEVIR